MRPWQRMTGRLLVLWSLWRREPASHLKVLHSFHWFNESILERIRSPFSSQNVRFWSWAPIRRLVSHVHDRKLNWTFTTSDFYQGFSSLTTPLIYLSELWVQLLQNEGLPGEKEEIASFFMNIPGTVRFTVVSIEQTDYTKEAIRRFIWAFWYIILDKPAA